MKQITVLITIIISITSLKAQNKENVKADYQFSLEQCLLYAFGNNYTRQVMKLTEDARVDLYNQSQAERYPNLNGAASETYRNFDGSSLWTGLASINTSMTLYQGGTISNTIEQNKLLMEQADYQIKQYDNNLVIEILQIFLTILGNKELLKSQEALLKVSEEQLALGKHQFDVGAILESDYLLLEGQHCINKNNLQNTRITLENNIISLKILLSMDPKARLEISYPETDSLETMAILPPQEYVVERALAVLPDLKINSYTIEAAKVGIKLAKANYLPTVSVSGGIGNGRLNANTSFTSQFSANALYQQVALNVSIPIYNHHHNRSLVTQQKIQLQQAELEKKQTQLTLEQTIIQEYQNVQATYGSYQANDVNQNAFSKTFEAYSAKYKAGAITTVDLIQQQNNYISTLNNYIQSKYEFILNRKMLDVYMGEPIKMRNEK